MGNYEDELDLVCKERTVFCLDDQHKSLCEETEENLETYQNIQSVEYYSNLEPPRREARLPTSELRNSVVIHYEKSFKEITMKLFLAVMYINTKLNANCKPLSCDRNRYPY
jgi:hypothetical protein